MTRIKVYVSIVVAASAALAALVYLLSPDVRPDQLQAASSFAVLGVLFQLVSYRKSKDAIGSITFLPFLAAIVLSPNWAALAAVGVAAVICEFFARRVPIKAIFNIAQLVLSASVCVLVYRFLDGTSILQFTMSSIPAVAVVLPPDPGRGPTALVNPGFVDQPDGLGVRVIFGDDLLTAISQQFLIPLDVFEKPL